MSVHFFPNYSVRPLACLRENYLTVAEFRWMLEYLLRAGITAQRIAADGFESAFADALARGATFEVREVFRSEEFGNVYGVEVKSGTLRKTGPINTMRHYTTDLEEAGEGMVCGISVEGDPEWRVGQSITVAYSDE